MSELRALARGVPAPEWRRIIDVPDPAANTGVVLPVESKRAWRLLSVTCRLVAAVAVANRDVVLSIVDEAGIAVMQVPALVAVTSGQTRTYTWATGLGATVTGSATAIALPLPVPCYLMPGERLVIAGTNNAADQIDHVRVVVIECYTGDVAHERAMQQSWIDHWQALVDLAAVEG